MYSEYALSLLQFVSGVNVVYPSPCNDRDELA